MRTQFVRILIGIVALLAFVGLSPAAIQAASAAMPASAGGFTIYLTFDDGPTGGPTDAILDTLKQYNVKATFFDEGGHIARGFGAEVRREVSEGHRVGNHLWLELTNIMYLAKPSAATLQQQYAMAEDEIHKALGDSLWAVYEKQPRLFRWPGGSPFVLPGMPNVYNYNWNVSSGDDVRGASVM